MNSSIKPPLQGHACHGSCWQRPTRSVTCAAASHQRQNLPPEDEAARRGEQAQGQQPQPWWSLDGLQLIPPKRRPQDFREPLPEDDWRAVRAKLVSLERSGALDARPPSSAARAPAPRSGGGGGAMCVSMFSPSAWAHELAAPEVGCVLVARQPGLDFFDGAVVLIAAHDDAQGSIGFILNRPSSLRVLDVAAPSSSAIASVADVFGAEQLRVGGPVHLDSLTVLHGYGGCQGAQKIVEGVYYGGLPVAASMVRSGLAPPSDFRLLLGLAGWAPGQLSSEIESGVWHCVAASKSIIMPTNGPGAQSPDSMRRQILGLLRRQHGQHAPP